MVDEIRPVPNRQPTLAFFSYDSLGNPWVSGGGALRDFEVLRRWAKHAQVILYTGYYPGFKPRIEAGVSIRSLGFGQRNWLCRLTFALFANLWVLRSNANFIGNSISIYAPILTGIFRPNTFFSVIHHEIGKESLGKFGWPGWAFVWIEKFMFKNAKRFLVLNSALARRLKVCNPRGMMMQTANGFDPALLSITSNASYPPYILFFGRFDIRMKGLDLLIPAFVEVTKESSTEIRLILAGRGTPEQIRDMQKFIPENFRDRIVIERNVDDLRKIELMAGCLFYCSPSRFEGFGIAALEANAVGKAALVTDTDGFRDSLAFGKTALVVALENQSALKQGMLQLIQDSELRDSLGRNGREWARQFNWDAIAEREWQWICGNSTEAS